MPRPNIIVPRPAGAPEMSPFSSGEFSFPITPGSASSTAQIAAALAIADKGIVRIDVYPTAAQMATVLTAPISVIPAALVASFLAPLGKIIVPVAWSATKNVSAVGAINTVLQVEYDDASWAGFVLLPTINFDTNSARKGQFIGFTAGSLSNTNTGVRSAEGKGIRIIGSADPGNFPATQISARFSILLYVMAPAP